MRYSCLHATLTTFFHPFQLCFSLLLLSNHSTCKLIKDEMQVENEYDS